MLRTFILVHPALRFRAGALSELSVVLVLVSLLDGAFVYFGFFTVKLGDFHCLFHGDLLRLCQHGH